MVSAGKDVQRFKPLCSKQGHHKLDQAAQSSVKHHFQYLASYFLK